MRLSWQEIRGRARRFSERWQDAHYEKGETQSFYNEFFDIFGVDRKRVAVFEKKIELIERNKRGFIDRSEEHTSELQSLMRISYAVFCLKQKKDLKSTIKIKETHNNNRQNINNKHKR